MKILRILFVLILIALVLAGVGLQIFLTRGLTDLINQRVLPEIRSQYDLDVSITDASVNLIKGRAEIHGATVKNLPGYEKETLLTLDSLQINLDLMSLLKRAPVIIELVEANGATLTVERNGQKKINVQELADRFKPEEPAAPSPEKVPSTDRADGTVPTDEVPATTAEQPPPPPIHIRRLVVDGTVIYADAQLKRDYPLDLRLTASNLFSVPAEGQPNSLIVLRGAMVDDKTAFTTDLNAILEPLTDPENPSFNATGSVLEIDTELLKKAMEKNNMSCTGFSIRPSIICKNGALKGSTIDLLLSELNVYGRNLGESTLPLKIQGTLQDPVLDLTAALQSLFSNNAVNLLQAIGIKELRPKADPNASTTNPSVQPEELGELLIDKLGDSVKEVGESEELKDALKQLFGK